MNEKIRSDNETINFRELAYTFWDNKYLILITAAIIASLACLYNWQKPRVYEANTILQVEGKKNNMNGAFPQQMVMGGVEHDSAASQIALIRSPFILEPVIRNLGLGISTRAKHFPIIGYFFADRNESLSIEDMSVPPKYFNQRLTLEVEDDIHYRLLDQNHELLLTGTLGVSAESSDKEISLKVLAMNGKKGTEFTIIKLSTNHIIRGLLANLKIEELGDATTKTGILSITFKDHNPERAMRILNAIARTTQEKDRSKKSLESSITLNFLAKQIPLAKTALSQAETELNKYRAKSGKLDIKIETLQLLALVRENDKQITQTMLQRADLLQRFTFEHPFLKALETKINFLTRQKNRLIQQIKMLPAADQIAVDLIRDVEVKNKIYLLLLNKQQETQVTKAATLSDVRILTKATLPDTPLPKYTGIILITSSILGLIIGALLVVARQALFRKVNDPLWIEQNLGLANLAIIPYSKQQTKSMVDYKAGRIAAVNILAQKHPRDLSIEALRSLRTNLQLLSLNASNNIISIMGVSPGIGKSFISVNFSSLLADLNQKVLLIDGDIRKGLLHRYFSVVQKPGLSEYLKGKNAIEHVIQKTSIPSLDFIPSGVYPDNPAELLMSTRFKEFLQLMSQQYDYVLIDTAPVLAVTDSVIIGAQTAINFLVIGSDTHQPEEVIMATKRLESANIKLVGTIFNVLKLSASVSGNYRYNYYGYGDKDTIADTNT